MIVIFLTVSVSHVYSQADSLQWHDRLSLASASGVSFAKEPLSRKYDRTPWSLSFNFGVKPSHSRYQFIFLQANYQRLAQFRNIFPVQSPQGGLFELNHTTRSNLLSFTLGYRYEFDQIWYLIPRLSFSFGTCNAYVHTSFKDNYTNEIIESFREASDWSYLSTLEGGFQIPLYSGIHASFTISYIRTGSLELYLPVQDPILPAPVDPFNNFERRRSSIDLLAAEIGLTLYFNQLF